MDRGIPVYILCAAKQGRQTKKFEFRKLQIVVLQTLHMKKQSIGKYSSMIEDHFDMLHCEFGAWMPDYERG